MPRPRVLVTPSIVNGVPGPYKQILEEGGFEVVYPPAGLSLADPAVLLKQVEGIDAVVASTDPFNRDVLSACQVRVVARTGVGYDSIDVAAATERGVAVTITPGTNEHSVAEQALALLLGVFRGLPGRIDEVRRGKWLRKPLPRLAGKTIGLVGLGRIGKAMVGRSQGLGLNVIGYDPYPDTEFAALNNVELCSLEELLARADIVSLHLPSTPDTHHLINASALALMKPRSVLINTSRGPLVDEDALVEALRRGHLLGAGLDVFQIEPLPTDSPLLAFPNVLATPHAGGVDEESLEAMCTLAARCVVDLHQGRWPDECVVNRELKGSWKW
jgi:D-3-phosphoglycerate dehydrogenase